MFLIKMIKNQYCIKDFVALRVRKFVLRALLFAKLAFGKFDISDFSISDFLDCSQICND